MTAVDRLRFVAIAFVLLVGGVHLQQYEGPLNQVPTIGTLFVLNAIGASAIALTLAASRRHAAAVAAVSGLGLTLGALVSLAISRASTLFDYSEPVLRDAVTFALVVELGAVFALSGFLLAWLREVKTAGG